MRVLHFTSELDGGGVERILYDYCTRMPDIDFDFVVTAKTEGILEAPLRERGARIFHITGMREDFRLRSRQIAEILRDGAYDVVHDHSGYKAAPLLWQARKAKVATRIAHSHMASPPQSLANRLARRAITPVTKAIATDLFSCGVDAGRWMWGAAADRSPRHRLMLNGVDTTRFLFSQQHRNQHRAALGLDGQLVIGNVARFSDQKNHARLLKIFQRVLELRPDAVLLLVGRGELYEHVQNLASELEIIDSVRFLGVRTDVPELLSAMDVFLLPSKYEGLPVVLFEVQANGLPIVTSTAVTDEARLLDAFVSVPLTTGDAAWARAVVGMAGQRAEDVSAVVASRDVEVLAEDQRRWYLDHKR